MAINVSNHYGTFSADHFFGSEIYFKIFVLNKLVMIEILHLSSCHTGLRIA